MTQYNISISINASAQLNETTEDEELQNFWAKQAIADSVFIWIISVIEVPLMLLTQFALCFLIKSHHAASVYVINLILSDLIQMVFVILSTRYSWTDQLWAAHEYSVIVGLFLMACIAFERYLLVCHPHWYRTHPSLKSSCFIALVFWFVPLIFAEIKPHGLEFPHLQVSLAYFIPYPIILLCFIGTRKGLSRAISLTSEKRKLILASLFLVLLNYTSLILPYSVINLVCHIVPEIEKNVTFNKVYDFLDCLLYLNPLGDCLLYLFMRTDAADIMKSLHCCRISDLPISVRYYKQRRLVV